jgi:hypothetical protein
MVRLYIAITVCAVVMELLLVRLMIQVHEGMRREVQEHKQAEVDQDTQLDQTEPSERRTRAKR